VVIRLGIIFAAAGRVPCTGTLNGQVVVIHIYHMSSG